MMHSQILKDKPISKGIKYLWNIIEQISQDPASDKAKDFLTDLPNILFILLGAENKKGWLTQTYESLTTQSRFSTQNAEENMQQLILLLSPPVISIQAENCYYKDNIYTLLFEKELIEGQKFQLLSNVLPEHITELRKCGVWKHPSLTRFQSLFSSEVSHITNQFIVISPGEWFLFALAFNLKNFRPSIGKEKLNNRNQIDPYAEEFITNPFLLLTRRYLEYFDFLSFSQMLEHKDKKNLFKKFSFILEEHLIVEQIFNICPQNLEILLHYSILDGLQYSELKQNHQQRKKSGSNIENDNTTILGDSKIQNNNNNNNMYESSITDRSKILNNNSQNNNPNNINNNNINNSQSGMNHQQTLINADIIDNFSGYTKNTILSHFQSILNIKEFYGKKGKESFQVHSNYIFQALLIILHFKRRHFKLLTITTLFQQSSNNNNNSRIASQMNSFYPQMQISQRSSLSHNQLYGNQNQRKSQLQGNNFYNQYNNSNNSSQISSQQYYQKLCQQYMRYRDFDSMDFNGEQFSLEYFRDEGEDNMLTLFYKKLSYFLSISLDDWQNVVSKQQQETLYDQGRLIASLIGHHRYFERYSCENDLFIYLSNHDQFMQESSIYNIKYALINSNQTNGNNQNNNNTNNMINPLGLFNKPPPQEPSRPIFWQYALNDLEFEKLLPALVMIDNSNLRSSQVVQTNYRQQIGYFNDELSQIRFKILVSSTTILLNKFCIAFASAKEINQNDFLIITLLTDIVFKKKQIEEKSLYNSMNNSISRQFNQDEDLVSRLNNLDIVTIKHANEFFLLRESTDDAYKLFITPSSLDPVRKIIKYTEQYLKKRQSSQKNNINNQNAENTSIDRPGYLQPDETDITEICQYLLNKLNYIQNRSYNYVGYQQSNSKGFYKEDNDGMRNSLFQVENKRKSYDFQHWQAPLASFESKILFNIFLKLSFFIDTFRNNNTVDKNNNSSGLSSNSQRGSNQKYPRTNLRKFANVYVALSYFFILVIFILGFNWLFFSESTNTSQNSKRYYSNYNSNRNQQPNSNSKFQWDLP